MNKLIARLERMIIDSIILLKLSDFLINLKKYVNKNQSFNINFLALLIAYSA